MTDSVHVMLVSGSRLQVEVALLVGAFAVHPAVHNGMPTSTRWTITHVPSGLSVWRTKTEEEAVACATWLAKNDPLPSHKKKCLEWAASEEASKLYLDLMAIAPYKEF